MVTIVGIGGGEVSERDTEEIDKKIIALSGKQNPDVVFISAASGDSERYCQAFSEYYGSLGCKVNCLKLIVDNPSAEDAKQILDDADIIYVGGGNTIKLMEIFKEKGLDIYFRDGFTQSSKVFCGLSAGCLCWFDYGMSDSIPGKWTFVKCLGIVHGTAGAGFLREDNRKNIFSEKFAEFSKIGYGIADRSAVIVNSDGEVKAIGKVKLFHK